MEVYARKTDVCEGIASNLEHGEVEPLIEAMTVMLDNDDVDVSLSIASLSGVYDPEVCSYLVNISNWTDFKNWLLKLDFEDLWADLASEYGCENEDDTRHLISAMKGSVPEWNTLATAADSLEIEFIPA